LKQIKRGQPTVEFKEHPPELLELDDDTVAIARAKFAGIDLDGIYGDEDRTSPELIVRVQSKKIRDLFETINDLKTAFSSEQKKAQAFKDMLIDGIDLEFVKSYCQKKQLEFSDDAEALIKVAFDNDRSGDANV
jgi:methylase of polypeptide subunit release factors